MVAYQQAVSSELLHRSDRNAWCYELHEAHPNALRTTYVEVEVPDANPHTDPFVSRPLDQMTFTVHGTWDIPWLAFRRFVDVITNG